MSKSGFFRSLDAGAKIASVIIVGIIFMVVGFGGAIYLAEAAVTSKTTIPKLAYFSGILGVLGALAMPSVFDALFPRVQKIFVFFFPNGLPLIGGKRAGDPPAPPPPPAAGGPR